MSTYAAWTRLVLKHIYYSTFLFCLDKLTLCFLCHYNCYCYCCKGAWREHNTSTDKVFIFLCEDDEPLKRGIWEMPSLSYLLNSYQSPSIIHSAKVKTCCLASQEWYLLNITITQLLHLPIYHGKVGGIYFQVYSLQSKFQFFISIIPPITYNKEECI